MITNVKSVFFSYSSSSYLQASGFKMIITDDLDDAAEKSVHIANIVQQAEQVALGVQFTRD